MSCQNSKIAGLADKQKKLIQQGASLKAKEIFEENEVNVLLCTCGYIKGKHSDDCTFTKLKKKHLGAQKSEISGTQKSKIFGTNASKDAYGTNAPAGAYGEDENAKRL